MLARVAIGYPCGEIVMVVTPGNGRGQTATTTSLAMTRNGIATNKTARDGRVTPVRIRNGDGNFVSTNAARGFETPTNRILSNVPSTVTIRSSERRRRVKAGGSDELITGEKSVGTMFVDSRFAIVKTPTTDSGAPRARERSGSNASAKSERGYQPFGLAKASSFCSDRPLSTPLQPTNKKENFFHAKDYKERQPPSRESSEKFFFASSKGKPGPSINTSRQRRSSNGSQISSVSSAKEVCQNNTPHYSIPALTKPSHQPRSPVSPTKATFSHVFNSAAPTSPLGSNKTAPSSPLRSSFVKTQTPSPLVMQSSPKEISPKQSPPNTSQESTSSSSASSAPAEISSDTSEDDLTAKSLLPTTSSDLESAARINRKVPISSEWH